MTAPPAGRIAELLQPYTEGLHLPADLPDQLSAYLELLLKWNGRTNLTAVRDAEMLVQRQVGESVYAARLLDGINSLLDFGSGAGFPGIPLQLALPSLQVTLAESQGKKASFLREAVRVLGLSSRVWAGRVEDLPATFGVVVLRAVDDSARMLPVAAERVGVGGSLLLYSSSEADVDMDDWEKVESRPIPHSAGQLVRLCRVAK